MRQHEAVDPRSVLSAYALREPRIVRQFESYGNDAWLVEEGAGARFVLRRQLLNGNQDRLNFQLGLQAHVAMHGVPTAKVVGTRDGADRVVDGEGVPWLLLAFVEGEEYDFSRPAQAAAAGEMLARFHVAAGTFGGEAPGPKHKPSIGVCWANHDRDVEELADMLGGEAAGDLRYLRDRWGAITAAWPASRIEALPAGWLHGDYHGRNLIYSRDDIVAFLDFDDVDRGPFAYDIASSVVKLSRQGRGLPTGLRPAVAQRFLESYELIRPLTVEERASMPVLAALAYPPNVTHYRWWRERNGRDPGQLFRDDIANIRTLESELARVGVELFAAVGEAP
jgi:Ser/Thr protein kinase RdoA (MazF antagonist)